MIDFFLLYKLLFKDMKSRKLSKTKKTPRAKKKVVRSRSQVKNLPNKMRKSQPKSPKYSSRKQNTQVTISHKINIDYSISPIKYVPKTKPKSKNKLSHIKQNLQIKHLKTKDKKQYEHDKQEKHKTRSKRCFECNDKNDKIYCGNKCYLPDTTYTRFGTPMECIQKGIYVGKLKERQRIKQILKSKQSKM